MSLSELCLEQSESQFVISTACSGHRYTDKRTDWAVLVGIDGGIAFPHLRSAIQDLGYSPESLWAKFKYIQSKNLAVAIWQPCFKKP